jgi:hypothetical protein
MISELKVRKTPRVSPVHCLDEEDDDEDRVSVCGGGGGGGGSPHCEQGFSSNNTGESQKMPVGCQEPTSPETFPCLNFPISETWEL